MKSKLLASTPVRLTLALLLCTGACVEYDELGDQTLKMRSPTILDQLTGQSCQTYAPWLHTYNCASYDLTLERDGTFFDSNGWTGTFDKRDDGVLELNFGAGTGIATLRETAARNDKCWEPDPDVPITSAGIIHVCTAPQPFIRVRNYINEFDYFTASYTYAADYEADHWAAAALTPPMDMQVRSVVYHMWNASVPRPSGYAGCWSGVPHRVQIFMGGDAPDATPEVIEEFFVDLDDASLEIYKDVEVELPLSVPLVVPAGTRLYVSLEMVIAENAKICVLVGKDKALPGTNYWSNSPQTPYPWVTLESFSPNMDPSVYTRNYMFELLGIPLDADDHDPRPAPPPLILDNLVANVDENTTSVAFTDTFSATPAVFAAMQTFNETDPADLALDAIHAAGFDVFVQEEQSSDSEVQHSDEVIGFLALERGMIIDEDGVTIGEVGTLPHRQRNASEWFTSHSYLGHYIDPVVIMMTNTWSPRPTHVRLDNVTSSSFSYQLEKWDYLNGGYRTVRLAYLVVESGSHRLPNGALLQATSQDIDHVVQAVSFPATHGAIPVVLSQSQTNNDDASVVTRQQNVSTDGVDIRLQEQEADDGTHNLEEVAVVSYGI